MSITHCIVNKAKTGIVNQKKVDELAELVNAQTMASGGIGHVDLAANMRALEIVKHRLNLKKFRTAKQIIAVQGVEARMGQVAGTAAQKALSIFAYTPGQKNPGLNIEYLHKDILGEAHALFIDGLDRYRGKVLNLVKDNVGMKNMIREMYGGNTGDAGAKGIAKSWQDTTDYLLRRFNAAGGDIVRRKDWRVPQGFFSMQRVGRVDVNEFIDDMLRSNDLSKIIDMDTNQPITKQRFIESTKQAYQRIVTDGAVDLEPGRVSTSLFANRHSESRFFSYKDADSWFAMQEKYGDGDIYSILVHHMDKMSRDTAILEMLGPNPDATVKYITDRLRKMNVVEEGTRESAGVKTIEDIWEQITGRTNTPDVPWWANTMQFIRNTLTSAQLGGAFLSATSDIQFQRITAKFNGIPQARVTARALSLFNPLNAEDRKLAVRLGFVAENWTGTAIGMQRFTEAFHGPKLSRHLSDFVMRASLLSPWTQAGRHGFGMEFLGFLADSANKKFDALEPALQRSMQRYGISAADWDAARAVPLFKERGTTFLRPNDVAAAGRVDVASKLKQMVLTETDFAVPTTTALTRTRVTGGLKAGTFWGEIVRSITLYKSFPVALMHTHLSRGFTLETKMQRGQYLANLIIGTTIFGAMAIQAKQIQRGKDMIDMFDPDVAAKFWLGASLQGGGLGIFGDFLFSDANRMGQGFIATAAGPVFGFLQDTDKLTRGNIAQLATGQDMNFGREFVRYMGRYTPGSSIWYARLAMERLILDQLQAQVDSKASQSFRAIEREAEKNYNQQYWWSPGRTTPERAPEVLP